MKTIAAGKFKSECLSLMDEVQATGEEVIVTKHGKPVVRLVPASQADDQIFGYMAGKAEIVGDIVSPAAELDEWDGLQ